uniref:Uncharacterized protein n=1 Tax=viral metagenome TaxID=1070528 RepID=A0A6M3K2K9_9ZZZZ
MRSGLNKKCSNCENAHPNYLHYEEGPCNFFGEEGEDWKEKDVLKNGCKFWIASQASEPM